MISITKDNVLQLLIISILVLGFSCIACEGPAGAEGPQGEQGQTGPVGPAGEDGSMMYAGEGVPGEDIGTEGDYYLDQNTGELYGPKDADGWGNPIIVLMGEDGQDGEDGSQIYAGSGAPDASLGSEGDYYLDKDSYDLYGPKTSGGWGLPLNLKGADGNANVTRYLYLGHDFRTMNSVYRFLKGVDSESEMRQSAWLIYLIYEASDGTLTYYSIPGYGHGALTMYSISHRWFDNTQQIGFSLSAADGSGEEYAQIEIIRIEASNTVDNSNSSAKRSLKPIIPDFLDVEDYDAVAGYYGFQR